MKIELASSYGFCFGVKRAIKIAENAKDAVTIGPIIHNNDEINRLNKNFNVKTLEGIDKINGAKKAIIRTHGITKGDLAELKKSDIKVIDATCPFVTKPQQICEKMSKEGSASNIATKDTSGKSNPSLSRFTPISTSKSPFLRSCIISIRSSVSTSLCT